MGTTWIRDTTVPVPLSVTAAEFVRRFGSWQDRAGDDPLFVTHHGRPRYVMLSLARYEALASATTEPDVSANAGGTAGLRLETLVAQLDGGFIAFDATLAIVEINSAACAYFGVTRTAALQRQDARALPELDRPVVRAHLARALAAGEIASFELPAAAHPGQWLHFAVFPYGEGVACLFRNVSGDRAARAADEERRALHASLAADGRIGLGALTLRGTFAQVDARLAALAGFAASALEQVRLPDILTLSCRVDAAAHVEAVLSGGAPRAFDSALLVNQGGERPVRIALAAVRGDYAIDGAAVVVTAL